MSVLDEYPEGRGDVEEPDDSADGSECRFPGVTVKRETEKALLCSQGGRDCWVPKSQIVGNPDVPDVGATVELQVTERFAPVLRDKAGWHL